MSTLSRPADWTTEAACQGLATRARDLWAPGEHLTPEERAFEWHLARRVCSGCPVRTACAVDAMRRLPEAPEHAMRGGLTPDELRDLARDLGWPYRLRAQHGTRSRYVAGCRCDDCRNAHRVYEHERRLWAGTRKRLTAALVEAWLVKPHGSGRHRAAPGQLLLFTTGLPETRYDTPSEVAS